MKTTFILRKCTSCTIIRTITLLLCLHFFFGCERRSLTYDYEDGIAVHLNIDWSSLVAGEERPAHIKAMFYPTNGGKPIERYLTNTDGERVFVPEGDYNIIVYNWRTNAESQTVQFRNHEEYLTHEAYTAEISRNKQRIKQPSDPIITQPDYTYAWSTGDVPQRITSKGSGDIVITAPMSNYVRFYQFTVDIYNPDEIRSLEGVISGTHGWVRLATGERSDNSFSTDISLTRLEGGDKEKAKFLLTFRTFGVIGKFPNNIVVETINPDDLSETNFTKDISDIIDQINKGILDNTEPIDISDPKIPIIITPGKKPEGGFKPPVVDDWDDVHGGDIYI